MINDGHGIISYLRTVQGFEPMMFKPLDLVT